ncbi:MAG: thioredoxin-disulfide reductase [Lachnospiraceae bacterium]|nr:thioredoxin-disulfide reductase [Lachnospiraceae bacterium]
MTDIIIVGAGTAGLTAAIYALRAGKTVEIFEGQTYGGQIINTPDIENYPGMKHVSGFEFATALYEQATELGAKIVYEKVLSVSDKENHKEVKTDKGSHECKAVILATGAKNRPLGLDKEQEFIGKGVSYCATCDGAFFRGKDVAVAGGGNTAVEDASFLCNYCNKVYIIHRRDQFRAVEKNVDRLREKPNAEFVLNANVTGIIGDNKVEGVEVTDKTSGVKRVIPVSGFFVAIGQMPENGAFGDLVDLDKGGYIVADETCTTRTKGIFTAGDCRTKTVRQLTTAASDGAVAALAAVNYVDELG